MSAEEEPNLVEVTTAKTISAEIITAKSKSTEVTTAKFELSEEEVCKRIIMEIQGLYIFQTAKEMRGSMQVHMWTGSGRHHPASTGLCAHTCPTGP
jgi:hypothetical protein